jgi:hypothetical protein
MEKTNLSQAVAILANLGVIGGILLLAYELRQNNELMADQARFNRLTVSTQNWDLLAENPQLAELRLKDGNGETLTPTERVQLEAMIMRVLITRQWSFQELPRDSLPVETWQRVTQQMPSLITVYEREKQAFDPEFVEWFDTNILERLP